MIFFDGLLMGILEGATEFLPVSSTAHLLILKQLLGFEGPPGFLFEVVIQFGAIAAVIWLYRAKLWSVALNFFRDPEARKFVYQMMVAFLPALVIGFLAHDFIKNVLFHQLWLVCLMLIMGGGIMLVVERYFFHPNVTQVEHISLRRAFAVGCMQVLAMIPGVSRSGATIIGGMVLGLDRRTAAEFSFFLAIPTILGASVLDLYKNYHALDSHNISLILIGFFAAFSVALAVVRAALHFVRHHGFVPFAWYRIVLGTAVLLILFWQGMLF